ncbi:MAG: hypothetical protein D3910_26245 [Candidatus Electrothrix sp. ATG2]|nr:hypothetical protein [Candidatus Electrothrix sp. ATG2]
MKLKIITYGILFCFIFMNQQSVAAILNTGCDTYLEYEYPRGGHMKYRGIHSQWVTHYYTGTNHTKHSNYSAEKKAIRKKTT